MKKFAMYALLVVFLSAPVAIGANSQISEDTQTCIDCHASLHPGIGFPLKWPENPIPVPSATKVLMYRHMEFIRPANTGTSILHWANKAIDKTRAIGPDINLDEFDDAPVSHSYTADEEPWKKEVFTLNCWKLY